MVDDLFEDRIAKMKQITGLENPNSNQQLLPWLQENGYPYEDMVAGHIEKALEQAEERCQETMGKDPNDNDYHAILEMRSEISKSSVKKYAALQKALSYDDTMKGAFQFNGASRTGRFSGRRFQPQNLAKAKPHLEDKQEEMAKDLEVLDLRLAEDKYGNPVDLLSGAVRTVVQPHNNRLVVGADLNAIENRVLGWVCEDEKILNVFRQGKCPYVDFATYMFKEEYDVLYDEYKSGDKSKRTAAKPGVLGAGYRLGAGHQWEDERTGERRATGLLGYAWNMGIDMTEEMAQLSISTFRETYTDVVNYWYRLQNAAQKCIQTHKPQKVGKLSFDIQAPFLRMTLPCGRAIHYYKPRYEKCKMPWGKMGMAITYEGLNDKNKWVRIQTHGGKLVENAVQAIARDILLNGMRNAKNAGLDIFLHVHDEIVISSDPDRAEEELETLKHCMTQRPEWAQDLPLGAGGSITSCFIKD
jgi:DNA polymerase